MEGAADFADTSHVGNIGIDEIVGWLLVKDSRRTQGVVKVPDGSPEQIEDDIDLHWTVYMRDGSAKQWAVEVKTDTQAHTSGNYVFETISNELTRTPGCFIKTKADILFYYLIETKQLHMMMLEPVRAWFIEQLQNRPNAFRVFSTPSTDRSGRCFHSIGRLVPMQAVAEAGIKVEVYDLTVIGKGE